MSTDRDGVGSLFEFDIPPNTIVYRYDVEINCTDGPNLSTGGGDDGKKAMLKRVCQELVQKMHTQTHGFGNGAPANISYVYDGRKVLYTNVPVNQKSITLQHEQMSILCANYLRKRQVRIEVTPCRLGSHEINLANFLGPNNEVDQSILTFLEMATSQHFINNGTHSVVGFGRLFENKVAKQMDNGIVMRNGLAKGVRVISSDKGMPKAALVADVKSCAFFAGDFNGESLLENILIDMMRKRNINPDGNISESFWNEVSELFRGVSGYLTYDPSRIVQIDSFTSRPVSEYSFSVDGKQVTMVDFFSEKKKVRINPHMPAARKTNDKDALFPVNCIVLLPDQRVCIEKMNEAISRELLNVNSTRPNDRYAQIWNWLKQIATGGSSEFLKSFGIMIHGKKNDVKIRVHPPTKVKYGNAQMTFQDKIYPNVRYLEPSRITKQWIVSHPSRIDAKGVSGFIAELVRLAGQKGLVMPQPEYVVIELNGLQQFVEKVSANTEFFMYIDNKNTKSHLPLKLAELRSGILTQHVTWEVASGGRQGHVGPQTLMNILNKTNMKLFGLNYQPLMNSISQTKFNMDAGDVFVIGLATSNPPRATAYERFKLRKKDVPDGQQLQSTEPMVVGVCANHAKNPYKFCGDYHYQPMANSILESCMLKSRISQLLNKAKKSGRKAPSIIFIIRDGISEGHIDEAVNIELKAISEACKELAPNWSPKFVYCVVDKKHNKRFFFKQADGTMDNTTPGCVIDYKFTRVDMPEFWLQSHKPLKGTAKMPSYVFPVNACNASIAELQGFLLMLCNNWQIVNLAPALPTPVRQAGELAKRGRNNYVELKRVTPEAIRRLDGTQQIDYVALNDQLGNNQEVPLSDTRFNA